MIYPVIVLIVCSIVIAILTIFVLPSLAAMLLDIAGKVALPLPSRILIGISAFMRANGWWLVPTVAFGSIFGLLNMYRSPRGKAILDEIFLVTPVLKGFVRKIDTSRLARTLAALLESGVDIGTSLDLTSKVLYLAPYRKAIKEVMVEVMEGMELSAALDATRRFTPDVVAVVESGEETGKLPETLEKLADDYEDQVEYMVKNMGQLIQPLIMVMMGGVVLFIILAVILPYIQVITTLGGG
jgi:type IV pilus assembly protein PilC